MRVLLAGATGFLGRHVARTLVERGHFVSCMVRLGSEGRLRLPDRSRSERVSGDVTDAESLLRKPLGCDAVVNLVGIAREDPAAGQTFQAVHVDGVANLLAACLDAEVGRVVHVSALRAAPDAPHPYRRSKFQGEEVVRSFPVRWTILRPSLVYGPGSPSLRWLRRLTLGAPLLPVPVPGREARFTPLWVEDLTAAIAGCLERPATAGCTFDAAGPDPVSMGEFVTALVRARGLPHWQVPLSPGAVRRAGSWLGRLPGMGGPPGTLDLLGEDHLGDGRPLAEAVGVVLTPLAEGMRRLVRGG